MEDLCPCVRSIPLPRILTPRSHVAHNSARSSSPSQPDTSAPSLLSVKTRIPRLYSLADTQTLESELDFTEEQVIHYHSACIAELRVLASEPQTDMDDDLLAAVVALFSWRSRIIPSPFSPTETAPQGLHVFLRAQAGSTLSFSGPGIRQAAFWAGFRQEFDLAFFAAAGHEPAARGVEKVPYIQRGEGPRLDESAGCAGCDGAGSLLR
ncbi:hypothetical protein BDW71DRAFT_25296 [Aspergillus fruticulosus]